MATMIIKNSFKLLLVMAFITIKSTYYSQVSSFNPEILKPDPAKEKMFLPYLAVKHGGIVATENWKKSNTVQYYKELWYYSESFYVKRGHLKDGVPLNEEIIDISRFESSRNETEEAIVILPGFKDALVLLPKNKLVHKP